MSANLFMKSITHAFLEMELKFLLYNLFLLCYIFLESFIWLYEACNYYKILNINRIKTRSDSRSSLATSSPDPSIVKKEPGTSTPYVEVQEQGMVMVRRPDGRDTDTEQQEEVSSDLEIEEPPPDDSYTGEAGSEASWMAGQAGECQVTGMNTYPEYQCMKWTVVQVHNRK